MFNFSRLQASLQSVSSQLYPGETLILSQANIGLYDGYASPRCPKISADSFSSSKEKDSKRTDGTVSLTSHRLIYVDAIAPQAHSAALDLALVRQTDYWAGIFTSSPKITLVLGRAAEVLDLSASTTLPGRAAADEGASWVCRVCGMSNETSGSSRTKCGLCGVIRSTGPALKSTALQSSGASSPAFSLPPSRTATPSHEAVIPPTSPALPPKPKGGSGTACSVCTFVNHRSMTKCEVCDSPLASTGSSTPVISTPPSRPSSMPTADTFVKLSFRQGGDKAFYAALKQALAAKAWQIDKSASVPVQRKLGSGIGASNLVCPLVFRADDLGEDRCHSQGH